jgi:hypothetical protein
MRYLISIAVLLTVFFWAGPGSVRYVSAHSVLVLASDESSNVSTEETQAKAQAERWDWGRTAVTINNNW